MPISGEQFDSDSDNTTGINARMYDFLKNNSDKAYTFEEIAQETGIAEKAKLETLMYQLILENMFVEGVVDKKIIDVHSYYRAI
jgi:hypothetical protein